MIDLNWGLDVFNLSDAPTYWQMELQDPANYIAYELHAIHDISVFMAINIATIPLYFIAKSLRWRYKRFQYFRQIKGARNVEIIWVIIPTLVLLWLAFPSFFLMITLEGPKRFEWTTIVTGGQWFWRYEHVIYDFFFSDNPESLSSSDVLGLVNDNLSRLANNYIEPRLLINVGKSSTGVMNTENFLNEYYKRFMHTNTIESYMLNLQSLEFGRLRILEVDNRLVLPK